MKRIFIALKVEPEKALFNMIDVLKRGLKDDRIKWTDSNNIHITLVFLGDTDDELIPLISSMLYDKCKDSGKFELILRGAGVFKNLNDPRVLWTGIDRSELLSRLNSVIVHGLIDTGIKIEERPFRPHLTLGRIKHITDITVLKSLIDSYENTEIQKIPVSEVILYESILLQSGPVYKPIEKVRL